MSEGKQEGPSSERAFSAVFLVRGEGSERLDVRSCRTTSGVSVFERDLQRAMKASTQDF